VPDIRPVRRHVFARVLSFDLECPHCGTIDAVRTGRRAPPRFHMVRSRWRCRACRRIYSVGLVVRPVRRAGNRPYNDGQPPDTTPTDDQMRQLQQVLGETRGESVGWYDAVNLICICGAEARGDHTHDCPLAYETF